VLALVLTTALASILARGLPILNLRLDGLAFESTCHEC
jgi:hypothetical protein